MLRRKGNSSAISFKTIHPTRFTPEMKEQIKRRNLLILQTPKQFRDERYLGHRITSGIRFEGEEKNKKIILMNNELKGPDFHETFWHEIGHLILDDVGLDNIPKKEKEDIVENYAQYKYQEYLKEKNFNNNLKKVNF